MQIVWTRPWSSGASHPDPAFGGIPRGSLDEGTVVVGVPVGNADFVEHFVNDIITQLSNMAARIDIDNIGKCLLLRAWQGYAKKKKRFSNRDFSFGL